MNAITPLQRWTRDDWIIPCIHEDASGTPVDLTGSTIGAELWLAGYSVFQPLTVSNGGIVRVSDPAGQFSVVVGRRLTANAPGDAYLTAPASRTRVLIYKIDTKGQRQTLGVVPFSVFDGSESLPIDEIPGAALVSQSTTVRLVVATAQGAPGPSSIPAAQISDSGAFGQGLIKAADAAAAMKLLGAVAFNRVEVDDTDYPVHGTDTYVGIASLTAPRTITLPSAVDYPPGQPLFIADESGACSTDTPIIVAATGDDLVAGQANITLASPFQKAAFHSNGTNLWTV